MDLSYETKKNIVKQYLDVSIQCYVLSLFKSEERVPDKRYVCEKESAEYRLSLNISWIKLIQVMFNNWLKPCALMNKLCPRLFFHIDPHLLFDKK